MTTIQQRTTIGQPTPLLDGKEKVTGHLRYVADFKLHGMLVAQMVQSDYAHAKIMAIHTEEALKVDGVVAVLTAEDMPNLQPKSRQFLLLARDRVRFYGQPIALVIAENEYAAADGAEKVVVDYEPLSAAISIDDAMADDAPLVWENGVPGEGNDDAEAHGAGVTGGVHVDPSAHSNIVDIDKNTKGNVDAAFADAAHIVERTFTIPVVHQNSLETHGMIAQPDPVTGGMTIWSSTQGPFRVRSDVANTLGISESKVRVVPTPVGGGFGGKLGLYEVLIAITAQKLNRPVRLILSRMSEMSAANPAPNMRIEAKLGCDVTGNVTALSAKVIVDSGIYPSWIANFAGYTLRALYRVKNYEVEAINVLTFKTSIAAYRAPAATAIVFAMDTMLDELSMLSGIDPVTMHALNHIQTGDKLPNGNNMPTVGLNETLDAITAHPIWQNRDQLRQEGYGVGLAIGAWFGAVEPSVADCRVDRDGTINLHIGAVDLTGSSTSFAMLAADTFGVSVDKINIVFGDTTSAPYGGTTAGSRTTYSFAKAVTEAAEAARQQVLEIAAEELEAAVDDLDIVDGQIVVKGSPSEPMSIGDIAAKTMQFGGAYAPIQANGRVAMQTVSPGYNAQLVQVKVDEETGEVHIIKHVAAQDVGKALNPMAIEGQIMGGAVQGLGWALYEGMTYDEQSGQLLSGTWLDYTMPTALQAGEGFEAMIVEVPSDDGFMGMRGVGEPPVVPTAAAVANAIAHATGVRLTQLPMNSPRVLAALNKS